MAAEYLNDPESEVYFDQKSNMKYNLNCTDYNTAANLIILFVKKHLELDRRNAAASKFYIGSMSTQLSEDDTAAIGRDELFLKIRRAQKGGSTPSITPNDIDISKLRYNNFYSRSAMRDEVTRHQIEKGEFQQSGVYPRTDTLYEPTFSNQELQKAYFDSTLHHIKPLRQLSEEYKSGAGIQDITKGEPQLRQHQWQAANLVLGPTNIRRIYEPGDMWDLEAERIYNNSFSWTLATNVQRNGIQVLTMESQLAAMCTDYLQYFYSECIRYVECMTSSDYGKRSEAPKNLIELVDTMISRFTYIETRHNDPQLLESLTKFRRDFCENQNQSNIAKCIEIARETITEIIEYGKREDARNGIVMPE